jgi:hypothetical protein
MLVDTWSSVSGISKPKNRYRAGMNPGTLRLYCGCIVVRVGFCAHYQGVMKVSNGYDMGTGRIVLLVWTGGEERRGCDGAIARARGELR